MSKFRILAQFLFFVGYYMVFYNLFTKKTLYFLLEFLGL